MDDTGLLFRKIHRGSYNHQIKALDALRTEALRDLAHQAPTHGPWWHGSSSGFWRHIPGQPPIYGRRQTIRCERCGGAGADLTVSGERSETREARFWGLSDPCKPRAKGAP